MSISKKGQHRRSPTTHSETSSNVAVSGGEVSQDFRADARRVFEKIGLLNGLPAGGLRFDGVVPGSRDAVLEVDRDGVQKRVDTHDVLSRGRSPGSAEDKASLGHCGGISPILYDRRVWTQLLNSPLPQLLFAETEFSTAPSAVAFPVR